MDAGFGALAFDFRNWGESERTPVTLGYREIQDVLGAVAFVQHLASPQRRIGVVGLSTGTAAAILAAAQTPAIEAIAKISPRPVLIIHGMRDWVTDVGDAHVLYRACGDPKALWVIERAGHARTRRVGIEEYDRRVAGFFKEHMSAMT